MTNRLIRINTLTDYHLNDFLNNPQSFWRKHLLNQQEDRIDWRKLVDITVNQAVKDFFSLPPSSRSSLSILRSISIHWNKRVDLFHSREHYYQVLGSMTTHLMQHLIAERDIVSPLYVADKLTVKVHEWDFNVTMSIPLAIWDGSSFTIKKFVTEENPEFTRSWALFTIFFCSHAFNTTPSKLEIVNILTGSQSIQYPDSNDYMDAKDYIHLLQETMRDPSIYFQEAPRPMH